MTNPTFDVDKAFAAFAKIVGEENILRDGEPEAERLRDEFLPGYETDREPRGLGGILPGNLEELQSCLKVANELRVPLWTISMGRNYGYGGPAAVKSGCVTLDLRRMNRIIEINVENAYAVVEPGVSPEMLWAEIERRGLQEHLHMDSASSPYGSLIGNAVDRGAGYSVFADRADTICGMEVVLPDGEIIRTGAGALSNSKIWHQYKYGFGPSVDGLFQQSNFGVVAKVGVWLMPRPEAIRHAEVYVGDLSERAAFFDILRDLRMQGVVDTGLSGGLNFGGHVHGAPLPGGGRGPGSGLPPGVRARLGFVGPEKVVDAKWEAAHDKLSALSSYSFNTDKHSAPYDYSDWTSEACMVAGISTPRELPSWDKVHYLTFASLVIPNSGRAYEEMVSMVNGIFERHGSRFLGSGFHMHTPRALMCLVATPLKGNKLLPDKGATIDNDVAETMIREVIVEAGSRGWLEYRTGTPYMDTVRGVMDFNNHALPRLHDRLKAALDPNGILSPGKSGIWPK